jgi:hypothetical protein
LAIDADLVLDLHCDGEAALHLYTTPGCWPALQPLADSWEYLPPGTFEGTNVRTVLLTMRGEA